MEDFLKKYRDNPGTKKSREKDRQKVTEMLVCPVTHFFKPFGGVPRLTRLIEALDNFDVNEIEEGIRLYGEIMPLALDMTRKFEELRQAQAEKKSERELNRLSGELADLYMQLQTTKNENNEILNTVKDRLYPFGNENYSSESYVKRTAKADEALRRLAEKYPGELGDTLISSLERFRHLQEAEKNGGLLPEGEELPEGMSIPRARKEAERKLLEAYRKVAAARAADYRDSVYGNITADKDEPDFLNVMGDILSDKWLVTKMAWKVRWKLGYRIYTSEKHGNEQKREYEAGAERRAQERAERIQQRANERALRIAQGNREAQGNQEGQNG